MSVTGRGLLGQVDQLLVLDALDHRLGARGRLGQQRVLDHPAKARVARRRVERLRRRSSRLEGLGRNGLHLGNGIGLGSVGAAGVGRQQGLDLGLAQGVAHCTARSGKYTLSGSVVVSLETSLMIRVFNRSWPSCVTIWPAV